MGMKIPNVKCIWQGYCLGRVNPQDPINLVWNISTRSIALALAKLKGFDLSGLSFEEEEEFIAGYQGPYECSCLTIKQENEIMARR